MKKPIVYFALIAAVAVTFVAFGDRLPDLAALKANLGRLIIWRDQSPILALGLFFLTYVFVAALSLPIGTMMSLAAGAIFGFVEGLVIVSFASSIGALGSFLAARYFLREAVISRFGRWLARINDGVEKDGAFYLFTLRLVPIVPFFVVNLVMGLTPLPACTFYWVSQIGMLAGSAIYVNAGTQIAGLESLSGVLSPSLLVSFVLIGVFPWLARAAVAIQRRLRAGVR